MMKKKMYVLVGLILLCHQVGAHMVRVYCYERDNIPGRANPLECYKVWEFDERTITWNNRPQPGVLVATVTSVSGNCWYEISSPALDQYIEECVANNRPISLRLKRQDQTLSTTTWLFYCKEQSSTHCAQLIYKGETYTPPSQDARVYEYTPNTNYCCDYLWVCDYNSPGRQEFFVQFNPPTGTEEDFGKDRVRFLRGAPSPFTTIAYISYNLLPEDAGKATVLAVYDIAGNLVKNLVNTSGTPGYHEVVWNGMDENGNPVSTGCYFYRLRVGELTLTTKAILLR